MSVEDQKEDGGKEETEELVCPVCVAYGPFLYVEVKTEVYDVDTWIVDEDLDEGFLRGYVHCGNCDKIVFPVYDYEIKYAEEILEKKYRYVFMPLDNVPEPAKTLLVSLLEEVKKYTRLAEKYYGHLTDMPEKEWGKIFGQRNGSVPVVAVGEDIVHVFLNSGSVHIAYDGSDGADGQTRFMVVYEKSVDDTLRELKRTEVIKLIEDMLSKVRIENGKLEAHLTLEGLLE
jgi:hypothetical protein